MRRQKREGDREREGLGIEREGLGIEREGLGSSPVPDPPPAGLAVAGGEVAAETLASTGDDGGRERRFWTEGKEAWSLGSSGGVLTVAGAHRNRPAWVVAAARERGSWGREERGARSRDREGGGVRWSWVGSISWALFFLLFSRWMDGWMWGGQLDG